MAVHVYNDWFRIQTITYTLEWYTLYIRAILISKVFKKLVYQKIVWLPRAAGKLPWKIENPCIQGVSWHPWVTQIVCFFSFFIYICYLFSLTQQWYIKHNNNNTCFWNLRFGWNQKTKIRIGIDIQIWVWMSW